MVKVKKGLLVFIAVIFLIVGVIGGIVLEGSGILEKVGMGSVVTLSRAQYDDYQYLLNTFGKADTIKKYIMQHYYVPVSEETLDRGVIDGMFASLDDIYSGYYSAEEYSTLISSLNGDYEGVGMVLSVDDNDRIYIVSVIPDSPASMQDVQEDDVILAVDGVEYAGGDLELCAARVRGEKGTSVTITFMRGDRIFDLTFIRSYVHNLSVSWSMLDETTGYIYISSIVDSTSSEFRTAVERIEKDGAEKFVLDLRGNGGGWVDIAVEIADMLMDKGTVVYTQDQYGNREYSTTKNGKATQMPFVVLVDQDTASAAEILTVGLQENGIAEIVGTQTYGKGIVQDIQQLTDGSAVKLTIMQYFSPSGRVINGVGVTPDHVVKYEYYEPPEDSALTGDTQLDAALEILGR